VSKSRTLAKRRDRRKAKASGWKRAGKTNPSIIGHGVRGSPGGPRFLAKREQVNPQPERKEKKSKERATKNAVLSVMADVASQVTATRQAFSVKVSVPKEMLTEVRSDHEGTVDSSEAVETG